MKNENMKTQQKGNKKREGERECIVKQYNTNKVATSTGTAIKNYAGDKCQRTGNAGSSSQVVLRQ